MRPSPTSCAAPRRPSAPPWPPRVPLPSPEEPDEAAEAAAWLRELLKGKPVPATSVFDQAREHLFCSGTICRVARIIGVCSRSTERQGPWFWTLPAATPQAVTSTPAQPASS